MTSAIIIAAGALALMAGPIGCFVVWRRMAYFGDGLAHSALLGVALGMISGAGHQSGILFVAILFALGMIGLRGQNLLANDTLLGILAHATLAVGLVSMSLMGMEEIDMHDFLLGDLAAITMNGALLLALAAAVTIAVLMKLWPGLVLMTTSEELAFAEGISVRRHEFMLILLMSLLVATSIQIVGVLLITSLLIIPASTARLFANSPEKMAIFGIIAAALSLFGGILVAQNLAIEAGPTIVTLSVVLFLLALIVQPVLQRLGQQA